MTEHDDVIEVLRRARPEELPEELVSPHAPAAQALLEEILSMQTIQPVETTTPADPAPSLDLHRRRYPRRLVTIGGLAAASIAAIVAVGTIVRSPVGPTDASAIDAALITTSQALNRSGRAEVTWHMDFTDRDGERSLFQDGVDNWEYSGEDHSVEIEYGFDGVSETSDYRPIFRYVGGEHYFYTQGRELGEPRWFHDIGDGDMSWDPPTVDPETLLADLEATGGFEEVGSEDVDGVRTRRLRAANPGATPDLELGAGLAKDLGEVTNLEVWVDDAGFVRRIDVAFGGEDRPEHMEHNEVYISAVTVSVRFSGFDEPIVIEVPAGAEDIDPEIDPEA